MRLYSNFNSKAKILGLGSDTLQWHREKYRDVYKLSDRSKLLRNRGRAAGAIAAIADGVG